MTEMTEMEDLEDKLRDGFQAIEDLIQSSIINSLGVPRELYSADPHYPPTSTDRLMRMYDAPVKLWIKPKKTKTKIWRAISDPWEVSNQET